MKSREELFTHELVPHCLVGGGCGRWENVWLSNFDKIFLSGEGEVKLKLSGWITTTTTTTTHSDKNSDLTLHLSFRVSTHFASIQQVYIHTTIQQNWSLLITIKLFQTLIKESWYNSCFWHPYWLIIGIDHFAIKTLFSIVQFLWEIRK